MKDYKCKTYRQERSLAWMCQYLIDKKCSSVNDVYGKPSPTKQAIDETLRHECYENGGVNYRIISHNVFFFTCGYFCETVDEETGELHTLMVIHKPSKKEVYGVSRFVRIECNSAWLTPYAFDVLDYPEKVISRFEKIS